MSEGYGVKGKDIVHFNWAFSGDGLLALAAGVITFAAVMIQIHYSSKQLRDQMKAQEEARLAEVKRRRLSLETAILFEIDDFYARYLQGKQPPSGVVEATEHDGKRAINYELTLDPNPFTVYQQVAGRLGELDTVSVGAIVHFYNMASVYLALLRAYDDAQARLLSGRGPNTDLEVLKVLADRLKSHFSDLEQLVPLILKLLKQPTGVTRMLFSAIADASRTKEATVTNHEHSPQCPNALTSTKS